jgi:hypothetical protein
MTLRKFRLGAVIISLALLLSACVEVKGDISVNSAARFNGELTYALDKSLASAAGLASLADLNSESSSSEELGFCKDVPFTEDSSNYILKCALKDAISESGDITASVVGDKIVFRYRSNLDATSDQTDFGSTSITVRFLDPVVSMKENKVGLVTKVDSLTYRISGYATETMNIEITANCASRCGMTNSAPAPEPSKTPNPTDAAIAAADAASKAANEAIAAAELKAKQEAIVKAAADNAATELKAKQEAAAIAAAEVKAAAEKAAAELKAAAEKAAADLKAAADKAIADKAVAEKLLADAKVAAAKILAAAKAAAAKKKTTITCTKGKLIKKVTAIKPVCPKGYVKKK